MTCRWLPSYSEFIHRHPHVKMNEWLNDLFQWPCLTSSIHRILFDANIINNNFCLQQQSVFTSIRKDVSAFFASISTMFQHHPTLKIVDDWRPATAEFPCIIIICSIWLKFHYLIRYFIVYQINSLNDISRLDFSFFKIKTNWKLGSNWNFICIPTGRLIIRIHILPFDRCR